MEKEKRRQLIKLCVSIFVLVLILIVVTIIIIKYEVEGDTNMPFSLSKIVIVSTAEGQEKEGTNKWNFKLYQNNDLYLYIDKNEDYIDKDIYIESIKIENIKIIEAPKTGEVKAYMPNSIEGRLYNYDDTYIIEDKLEYRGADKSNSKTLEIGKNGGMALIRFSNTNLGEYSSDKDKQIVHDGTLLKKIDLTQEDINFKISFDLVMKISKKQYRANIKFDLPYGNIIDEGTSSLEKTDMSDVIFKRD